MNTEKNLDQENPRINIIDLDSVDQDENINYEKLTGNEEDIITQSHYRQAADETLEEDPPGRSHKWIWHVCFLAFLLLCILFIAYRFSKWGKHISLEEIANKYTSTEEDDDVEVLDNILPHLYEGDAPALTDGETNIVFFGNGPFAEDRGTSDNVINRIAKLSGANVYNCSVSGSHLSATEPSFYADLDPMDAFNFYWLVTLVTLGNKTPCEQALAYASDTLPPEAQEVYNTLCTIDFSTIDVIAIMYDATEYLEGRLLYNGANETDIQYAMGNLTAGIELLQSQFPHIRIITMSPTYAYAINKEGEYVSSDIYIYNEYPLSTYAMLVERVASNHGVSFLDNIYGTVNEKNAHKYLLDNVHLNDDGKEKLAERFVYALQYYDN